MRVDKVKTYLGFAVKSGKIIFGVDKLLESSKRPHLIIICSTQNEKVSNKVIRYGDSNNVTCIKLDNLVLGDIIGRDNCKVVGILDLNLAIAIKNEFQMESEIN